MKKGSPFDKEEKIGRFGFRLEPLWVAVANHPVQFIVLISLISVVFGVFIFQLKIDPSLEAMSVENSPAKISYKKFIDTYGTDEFLVVAAKVHTGDLFTTERLAKIKALSDDLASLADIREVVSLSTTSIVRPTKDGVLVEPLFEKPPKDKAGLEKLRKEALGNPLLLDSIISKDGTTAVWFVFPDLSKNDTTQARIALFNNAKIAAKKHLNGFEVHLEGIPTVKSYMVKYIQRGMILFGTASAIILGILLFITFRSLRGVFLPGLIVGLALVWTLGIKGATGGVMDSISSLLFALIMVVGVGDAIHVLVHYLEEYFRFLDRKKAVVMTMKKMFTPCLLTSVTTSIGFLSLVTIDIPPIATFGKYAAVGVMSAFVISIILAPALLMLMKEPTRTLRRKYDKGPTHKSLIFIGEFNKRRKIGIIFVSVAIVIFSVIGISRIRVETRVSEFFHPWSEIVRGYKFLKENVSPPIPVEIIFEGEKGAFLQPDTWRWIETLQQELVKVPLIERADSYCEILQELNWALKGGDEFGGKREIPDSCEAVAQFSMLFQDGNPDTFERFMGNNFDKAHISIRLRDSGSKEQVVVLEKVDKLLAHYVPNEIKYEVAGGTVIFVSTVQELTKGQVRSLILALLVITLLITVIFRSLKIGLLSMIPNVLPIITMLGIMGWLDFPLDTNTVMIGPITLGIAVDDTIHYITRYKRERRKGLSPELAMTKTLTSTGRALLSTSVILTCGFVITIFSSFRPQSILGGLGGLTIMMALAADLILLPAVMLLFMRKDNGSAPANAE